MSGLKLFLAGTLALLLLVLVVQNSEVVEFDLLFWKLEMSRAILILLATTAGFVCGFVVAKLSSSGAPRA